ncbi:ATP-grasp domain-containing protein [Deinococcus hopiensis]|nr:ATP-grasp domain-containing protein [Deinococcus hopiensis]
MMRPEVYAQLHGGLRERGLTPIHTPEQYRLLHHLPESFPYVTHVSPRAVWSDLGREAVRAVLAPFGEGAFIVNQACASMVGPVHLSFPTSPDTEAALRVIETFLVRQGGKFQGGLILRACEPFIPLTRQSRSGTGTPLTRGYRLFFPDGHPVGVTPYWAESKDNGKAPPLEEFAQVAASIPAWFFTLDVAQRTDSKWRAVQLGDGQVAGRLDQTEFYRARAAR